MSSFICVWINGWVNNGEAGDLRRHRTHYDVIVMSVQCLFYLLTQKLLPNATYLYFHLCYTKSFFAVYYTCILGRLLFETITDLYDYFADMGVVESV